MFPPRRRPRRPGEPHSEPAQPGYRGGGVPGAADSALAAGAVTTLLLCVVPVKLESFPQVDIEVLLVELKHAGKVFPGSREEIHSYLDRQDYQYTGTLGNDTDLTWLYPTVQAMTTYLCAMTCWAGNTVWTRTWRPPSLSTTSTTPTSPGRGRNSDVVITENVKQFCGNKTEMNIHFSCDQQSGSLRSD